MGDIILLGKAVKMLSYDDTAKRRDRPALVASELHLSLIVPEQRPESYSLIL